MNGNLTYWLEAIGIGTGVRDFTVQVIAGVVAGLILIAYTYFVLEPKREAKLDKKETERTEKQNRREDELRQRDIQREDKLLQEKKEADQRTIKLKELHEQLLDLYKPYHITLLTFQTNLPVTRKIDSIKELELAFSVIESKTKHRLNSKTNECRKSFVGTPTENTLTNFLDALKSDITDLETEIEKI